MPKRVIVTCKQGYFDDLVVYLFAIQNFVHAVEVHNSGTSTPWPNEDTSVMDAKQANMRLCWHPSQMASIICRNSWPQSIEFHEEPNPLEEAGSLELGAIGRLLFSFGQTLIINYYERHLDEIKAHYGKAPADWPSIWNFARVVRNAMSHGGHLNFENPKASSVSWGGLTYSPSDNGRLILHTDIWPGDLYYLLRDMENSLPAHSQGAG
ncbi:hypothetical protein LPW26_23615 [Rhodopseudomonas sp. HC1]|uniref:hypothetical protein n=1 Tax=Rhodopseudomonas infernalis TaxID=2897386 RepID=UPI001EE88AE1|nr:hypothetical protein [Rhodopseudomonas infernalis]MCG6207645.1 hypothetical protein [Rhodopseudomonas infernalis]